LRESGQHKVARAPVPALVREVNIRAELLGLRAELQTLLDDLDAIFAEKPSEDIVEAAPSTSATSAVSVQVQVARRPPA
jgi:hypothetical protein